MKKSILLLITVSLFAHEEAELDLTPKKSFTYLNTGLGGPIPSVFLPDISWGWRKLHSHHVFDVNFGIVIAPLFYGQVSYLYYPTPSKGFYFGAGLAAGVFLVGGEALRSGPLIRMDLPFAFPYVNLPLTLGYQISKTNKRIQFIQFQATPLGTATVSYGFGF